MTENKALHDGGYSVGALGNLAANAEDEGSYIYAQCDHDAADEFGIGLALRGVALKAGKVYWTRHLQQHSWRKIG
jgi:hypothetical protein